MKRLLKVAGIICGIIFILLVAARLTGVLQFYKIPTPSSEPTIKVGERIMVSNLKKILPGRFIIFINKYEDSLNATYMQDFKPGTIYLHRLCGIPGNVLQMKDAVLFVNGVNFDEELNLKNEFEISAANFNDIIEETDKTEGSYKGVYPTQDSILIAFDRTQIKKYQPKLKLIPFIIKDTTNGPFKWLNENTTWTADNFGPLVIPADCYFVIGDNRHNALDSRYFGFIKAADIKGVVLNK